MSKRVLLSGFEPFGDFATNPSWDALELAQREGLLGDGVSIVRVPVTYADAFAAFEQAVTEYNPEAAISFGVYGSKLDSSSFRKANQVPEQPAVLFIETLARNRDGANKADNAGRTQGAEPIVPGAPETLQATFPAMAMQRSLKEAGFEAELSEDAGGYLCNHLFYRAAHAFGARFPYGFVHVPPVDSMGGSLSLKQLANAMALLANTLVEHSGS
jgi:pyroglutamyl-peptidase